MRTAPPLLPWEILFSAFVCGILALAWPIPAAAALALLCALTLSFRLPRPGLIFLLAAFGAGYGAAFLAFPAPPPVPDWMAGREKIVLTGRVDEVEPRPGDRTSLILSGVDFRLAKDQERPPERLPELPGKLALNWIFPTFRAAPGDVLTLTARVFPVGGYGNPGGADFDFYWLRQGVFYRTYAVGEKGGLARLSEDTSFSNRLRERIRNAIIGPAFQPGTAVAAPAKNASGEPESAPDNTPEDASAEDSDFAPEPGVSAGRGMVLALLTGDRSMLPREDLDLVRRASLAHSLALSGMHLGFAAALGWLLARLIGYVRPSLYLRAPRQKLAVYLAAPFLVSYLWLGDFSPSLVRAALMFACWGALILAGRNRVLVDGLFFALALIVIASPLAVFDLRLQLSALAVAGIAAFWPLGQTIFERFFLTTKDKRRSRSKPVARWPRRLLGFFLGILWTSLCAQAGLFPVAASAFGEMSPHIWLNLVWLPVLAWAVMPLAFAGLAASLVPGLDAFSQTLFSWSAAICDGFLAFLTSLDARGLLEAVIVSSPEWPQILGYFLLLFIAASWRPDRLRRDLWLICLALALLLGPGAWRAVSALRGGASLTMLDVGQGQSILLEAPPGRRILVDGGGAFGDWDIGRAVISPALTVNRPAELSRIVLTHPHSDHFKGLAYPLGAFRVGALAVNGLLPEGEEGLPFREALKKQGFAPEIWTAGDVIDLGEGYTLEVLSPASDLDPKLLAGNNGSIVIRLTFAGRGLALLCGDVENRIIRKILASGRDLSADVLVLPHHGSKSSRLLAFYKAVSPKIALASCGAYNHFNYPSEKVVESLARLGCKLYVSARDGAVSVTWDDPKNPAAAPKVSTYAEDGKPFILRSAR